MRLAQGERRLSSHHGSAAPGMGGKKGGGFDHGMAARRAAIWGAAKGGGGRGGSGAGDRDSWNCTECGWYNFEFRTRCKVCFTAAPNRGAKGSGKTNGGGDEKAGTKGGGKSEGWCAAKNARIKQLEEELRAAKGQASGAAGDRDDVDVDGGGGAVADDAVATDISRIAELQRALDAVVAQVGADDYAAKELRARVDAARAAQRATKSVRTQLQAALRRAEKVAKSIEGAKSAKMELEKARVELDAKIRVECSKVDKLEEEAARIKEECSVLHQKELAEDGTAATGGNLDVDKAWATLMEETRLRVSAPNADPIWLAQANTLFGQLSGFLSTLPPNVASGGTHTTDAGSSSGGGASQEAFGVAVADGRDLGEETSDRLDIESCSDAELETLELESVNGETKAQTRRKVAKLILGKFALRSKASKEKHGSKKSIENKPKDA